MMSRLRRPGGLLLILWLLSQPGHAAAHAGGTLQLANETVGPYLMSLWTLPEPLRAGEELHVSLFLLTPTDSGGSSQDFILDANVEVVATAAGGQDVQRGPGLHIDPNDPFYYETDLFVDDDGVWEVTVLVDGPDGGGEVNFSVEVLPKEGSFNWRYLLAALAAVGVAGTLIYRRAAAPGGER